MAPLLGAALIGGGASLVGGLLGNASSAKQAAQSLQAQERAQERQNAFTLQMATTAHQREVADLQAAGLNPILSGTGGMGAPSPSGAGLSGGAQAPQSDVITPAVSSALAARRNHMEIENMAKTNRNIEEDSDLKRSQRNNNSVLYNKLLHDVDSARWIKDQEETTAHILRNEKSGSDIEGDIDRSGYGDVTRRANRLAPLIGSASQARRAFGARPRP